MATWHEAKQVWVASRQIEGKRRFFRSRISAEDADAQAASWPLAPGPVFEGETFAAFVYGPWKANVWPDLKPKSRDKYNGMLTSHILPVLGMTPLATIGLDEMLALKGSIRLRGRKRPGKPCQPRTAASVLSLALSILRMARRAGKTSREDWALVKLPKFKKKKPRQELPASFTADLLGAASGTWMAGPIFAALFLGLRLGEACGLRWSAVDRQAMTITIDVQRQRQTGKGTLEVPTKGERRVLYVDEGMLGWLAQLGNPRSVYVFTTPSGKPIRPDKVTQRMPALCTEAGVPRVTFHDLRSYAASNLAALGADLPVIMSILGHTKADVTMLYVNAQKERIRSAFTGLLASGMGRQESA